MTEDDGMLARRIAERPRSETTKDEAELYRRLAPRARLYGLKHLRDASAADDLVQTVLVQTFEGLRAGRVREPEKIGSYVLGFCRMQLLEWRKVDARRARLLAQHFGDAPEEMLPNEEPPELFRSRLAECLHHLNARLRTLIALTFYQESSSEEIARELGTTAGNVRVMRHRALTQLHDCLEANARGA